MSLVSLTIESEPAPDCDHGPTLVFETGDAASVRRAQVAVAKHFSLSYLPVLCSPPEPGMVQRALAAVRRIWTG